MEKITVDVFYLSIIAAMLVLTLFAICVALYYREVLKDEERRLLFTDVDAFPDDEYFIIVHSPRDRRKSKTKFKIKRQTNPSPRRLASQVCLN